MSETEYNFQLIEKKAQKYWEENKSFEVEPDPKKEKFYCLSMFPYPSGQCHMAVSYTHLTLPTTPYV